MGDEELGGDPESVLLLRKIRGKTARYQQVQSPCHNPAGFIKEINEKKVKIIVRKNTSEAGLPVFREAVSAVDGPTLSWLERDFAFFSAV